MCPWCVYTSHLTHTTAFLSPPPSPGSRHDARHTGHFMGNLEMSSGKVRYNIWQEQKWTQSFRQDMSIETALLHQTFCPPSCDKISCSHPQRRSEPPPPLPPRPTPGHILPLWLQCLTTCCIYCPDPIITKYGIIWWKIVYHLIWKSCMLDIAIRKMVDPLDQCDGHLGK